MRRRKTRKGRALRREHDGVCWDQKSVAVVRGRFREGENVGGTGNRVLGWTERDGE